MVLVFFVERIPHERTLALQFDHSDHLQCCRIQTSRGLALDGESMEATAETDYEQKKRSKISEQLRVNWT